MATAEYLTHYHFCDLHHTPMALVSPMQVAVVKSASHRWQMTHEYIYSFDKHHPFRIMSILLYIFVFIFLHYFYYYYCLQKLQTMLTAPSETSRMLLKESFTAHMPLLITQLAYLDSDTRNLLQVLVSFFNLRTIFLLHVVLSYLLKCMCNMLVS